MGEVITGWNCDGEYIGGMTSTTNFKQMTNFNNNKVNNAAADRSLLRSTARHRNCHGSLAVVIGIAAMNVPAAEAYTQCHWKQRDLQLLLIEARDTMPAWLQAGFQAGFPITNKPFTELSHVYCRRSLLV